MSPEKLYVFTADSLENIEVGIQNSTWAVPTSSDVTATARFIRSQEMPLLSRAIFYCLPLNSFTVPFRIRSKPQPRFQSGIWSETYRFPFVIYPLGDTSKRLDLPNAKQHWPFIRRLLISSSPNDFIPSPISGEEWKLILKDLATSPDDFPEP